MKSRNNIKSKYIFLYILSCLLFVSCERDDNSNKVSNYSITSDGKLSGAIVSKLSPIDSLFCYTSIYDSIYPRPIASSFVDSKGNFSMQLNMPLNILNELSPIDGVVISDKSTLYNVVNLEYSSNGKLSPLIHSNMDSVPTLQIGSFREGFTYIAKNPTINDSTFIGYSQSVFIFVDRDVSLKGLSKGSWGDCFYHISIGVTKTFNLNLKRGWNEIVYRINKYNYSNKNLCIEGELTNTIVPDMKWRCFPDEEQGIWR